MARPKSQTPEDLATILRYLKRLLTLKKVKRDDELLDGELMFYQFVLLLFPNDRDLHSFTKALEFCTNKFGGRGDIYGKTIEDLTGDQVVLLEGISDHIANWLRKKLSAIRSPSQGRRKIRG